MVTPQISTSSEPLELTGPTLIADPYPEYARLRADGGVHYSRRWDCWFVSRYDLCLEIFNNAATFDAVGQPFLRMLQAAVRGGAVSWRVPHAPQVNPADAARRSAGRRTTGRALSSGFVDTLWPDFERECAAAAAELGKSAGPVDLIRDYAAPLTTRLLAGLLAVSAADFPLFQAWTESGYEAGEQDAQVRLAREIRRLFARQAVDRMTSPVDDFVGYLAAHPGEIPGRDGVGAHLEFVLGTGLMISLVTHQGLVFSFGTLMNALLREQDSYRAVRADRSLIAGAVEEGLRYDTSTQALGRLARTDAEIGGVTIPAGALVVCLTGSANRDERQWTDAGRFDIHRDPRAAARHLGFGVGATSCLGALISRRALGHLLGALVEYVAAPAPLAGARPYGEFMTRGYLTLPCRSGI
ncbi:MULTISPECIES: cytochrome P450 [unclassified Nocardia]|uniref:cytochrome P450 n=1 Tax=unclassified Nocardia TaxID=2637762 RepID=UPI001CE42F7E|nr:MULTISPECIES: cytochrome P450 [unclassified Nocardia]